MKAGKPLGAAPAPSSAVVVDVLPGQCRWRFLMGREQGECPTGVQDGAESHAESCLLSARLPTGVRALWDAPPAVRPLPSSLFHIWHTAGPALMGSSGITVPQRRFSPDVSWSMKG